MFNIIKDIYKSEVSSILGFKGDTAAYFFDDLDRFSTDLDFDLLDISQLAKVQEIIGDILIKYGDIDEKANKKNTSFFLLNYQKGLVNINIEINKRKYEAHTYEHKNFYGTNVLALKREDAFVTKLIAATNRKKLAMRDFYDMHFYLKKGILPSVDIVEQHSKDKFVDYIEKLIIFIEENIKTNNVLKGLGEVLDNKQKAWVKNNLKTESVEQLRFLKDNYK